LVFQESTSLFSLRCARFIFYFYFCFFPSLCLYQTDSGSIRYPTSR
jgi:hypothetical protein